MSLIAYAKTLSATGNLTISFNKPIIIPPILVDTVTVTNTTRLLTDVESEADEDDDSQEYYYHIKDVIELSVESSFYEEGSNDILISNYTLTRMTERELDIFINFKAPQKIT